LKRRTDLPAEFFLSISREGKSTDYRARTIWRRGNTIRVTFSKSSDEAPPLFGLRRGRGRIRPKPTLNRRLSFSLTAPHNRTCGGPVREGLDLLDRITEAAPPIKNTKVRDKDNVLRPSCAKISPEQPPEYLSAWAISFGKPQCCKRGPDVLFPNPASQFIYCFSVSFRSAFGVGSRAEFILVTAS
jgi:hypothetical protein